MTPQQMAIGCLYIDILILSEHSAYRWNLCRRNTFQRSEIEGVSAPSRQTALFRLI